MHWIYLLIAGIFEISWAVCLKYSSAFSKITPSVFTVICMLLSFYFLSLSLKNLPLGTAYAVWTGIGIIGTVIFGIILFKEPATLAKFIFITLIISGIAGLKLLAN